MKYPELNRNYFSDIDTAEKAYFLGWIASDGSIGKDGIQIQLHGKDEHILRDLASLLYNDKKLFYRKNDNKITLQISSTQMANDVRRHLKLELGKKSSLLSFPELDSENLDYSFIRGYFEGDGYISRIGDRSRTVTIASNCKGILDSIAAIINLPHSIFIHKKSEHKRLQYSAISFIFFLRKIYQIEGLNLYLHRKHGEYLRWEKELDERHVIKERRKLFRICQLCKVEKGVEEFSPRYEAPGDYKSYCKICMMAYSKERRQRGLT